MSTSKISEYLINYYLELLKSSGEEGLYRKSLGVGIIRFANQTKSPEIEYLDLSDAFFTLNRRNDQEEYFIIGKVLRRTAHTLYRQLKQPSNKRFLNVVR